MTTGHHPLHTILVIEDDEDSRTMLGHFLTNIGYHIAMARNGLEGLEAARTCHPTLILLDLQMPVMDGLTFRQHQLRDPSIAGVPVVCVSSLDSSSTLVRELGAVQFVGKPIDFDQLLSLVNAAATKSVSRSTPFVTRDVVAR